MRLFVDTAQVVITETPVLGPMHVLTMLLRNDLDVAFLPGGQLEELAAEGAIRAQDFKVIEPRPLQGYAGASVSTESYPEWPLGVMVRAAYYRCMHSVRAGPSTSDQCPSVRSLNCH